MKRFILSLAIVALLVPGLAFAHGIDSNRPQNEIEIEEFEIDVRGRGNKVRINTEQTNNTIGGNNVLAGGEGGEGGAAGDVSVSTEVNTKQRRIPVNTATAPALTSGNDVCMGSTSIGGQARAFGFSFGTTWTDTNCVRLKNANALAALGHNEAALSLLAQNVDVARALRAAGVKVWNATSTAVVTSAPVPASTENIWDLEEGQDG